MTVTSYLFEACLKCSTKCWLQSRNESNTGNGYADWVKTRTESYRSNGIKRLMEGVAQHECVVAPSATENLKTASWRLAVDFVARAQNLESRLHAVERLPSEGRGKPAQFIPIRFIATNKLTKDDKLLLAYDALVLSEVLGREVGLGKIIHGEDHVTLKLKTSALAGEVRKLTEKVVIMLSSNSPPDLVLNRHCPECEFQARCRGKAIEKDDLSLMTSMTAKERTKYHRKGIFTISQLSYTFRPRRRPKRLRDKREKYHHSLKALAIREKKIHIVGRPELKIEGTPVYFDVEGIPDRDFYYLIGVSIGAGESVIQHSLWADHDEDEKKIWDEFLGVLAGVENPVLIHYGSFETTFLKRMCDRYHGPTEGSATARAVKSPINLLSIIFAQIYFPGFSNGLKEAAYCLGYRWIDSESSGLRSIVWRHQWEQLQDTSVKEKLIRYNAQDCEALNLVTDTIRQFSVEATPNGASQNGEESIVRVDSDQFQRRSKWRQFTSPLSSFEYINPAAHWDYQRDRVYARSRRVVKSPTRRRHRRKMSKRVEKIVIWKVPPCCPRCKRVVRVKGPLHSKTVHDILFGRHSLKRRLLKYVFQAYQCRRCGISFGVPERFQVCRDYGWNLIVYLFYQVVELCIPQRTVVRGFNRLLGFDLSRSTLNNLKAKTAEYYAETKQRILERLVNASLVHADETRANVKGTSAYVWVLASFHEVVYILAESREGETVKKLLSGFKGVLVSDFYPAYDSIDCPQQKCLIHLMRDLNDEILNNPFDEQLKEIVVGFGNLLKPMVETVDRYGLKERFLKKHLARVERFYGELVGSNSSSNHHTATA